jgi:Bacterial Ig-like domain (group 3)
MIRKRRRSFKPRLEILEDRALPSTFSVTNTVDSGAGSLRQAILDADANGGTVVFDIPNTDSGYQGATGSFLIQPVSQLPGLAAGVTIDGYSQPGAAMNTLQGPGPLGQAPAAASSYGDNAVVKIVLDGSLAGSGVTGLNMGDNCTVQGLVIDRFTAGGIVIYGASDAVQGNFFGTDVTGSTAYDSSGHPLGNFGNDIATSHDSQARIGGPLPSERNLISGAQPLPNSDSAHAGNGILLNGDPADVVEGNFIGTDAAGKNSMDGSGLPLGNTALGIFGSTHAIIGNLISGNQGGGIYGLGGGVYEGNFIGTDVTGTVLLPAGNNGTYGTFGLNVSDNSTIGVVGSGNLISLNATWGVLISGSINTMEANYIGTDVTGAALSNVDAGRCLVDTGVYLKGATSNTVGGITPGTGNLISGNQVGITIDGAYAPTATGNTIEGNEIGTDRAGTTALGNQDAGIIIGDNASNNIIGGRTATARNIISGNGYTGEVIISGSTAFPLPSGNIIEGNYIGTDVTGMFGLGHAHGVIVNGGTGTIIGGTSDGAGNVISGESNNSDGILLTESDYIVTQTPGPTTGTLIEGNYIGTNPAGTPRLGNSLDGIGINGGATGNTVGGTVPGAANVISGNARQGIDIAGNGNLVEGNYIGTDASGTMRLGNGGDGIRFASGAANNIIGGVGAGNIISANSLFGVQITAGNNSAAAPCNNNSVVGNFIGTNAAGNAGLGNGASGVDIDSGSSNNVVAGNAIEGNAADGVVVSSGASNNTIGGTTAGSANTISTNSGDGVFVQSATGVSILGNSIGGNGGLGINLDGATNANNSQAAPLLGLACASDSGTVIAGTLAGTAGTTYRLEFFVNPPPVAPSSVQGQTFLGAVSVTLNTTGQFTAVFSTANLAGQWITATATDPNGDTSQFSTGLLFGKAATSSSLQAAIAALPSASTFTFPISSDDAVQSLIRAINGLTGVSRPITIVADLGGGTYSTGGIAYNPTDPNTALDVTWMPENGTLDPSYPALTVGAGHVLVQNCTLLSNGDTSSLVVTGGSVALRNDNVVQASATSAQPVINITGGSLDLGTTASPGNNTLSANSTGALIQNTTPNLISAVGNTFESGGTILPSSALSFTTLSSSANPTTLNQAFTLTATVRANSTSGTPTGTVTFVDTTTKTTLAAVTLSTSGTATLTISNFGVGNHVIQARYSGDGNFLFSAGVLTQSVQYKFSGFLAPLNSNLAMALNRTVPIKFQLTDANNTFITSLSAVTSLQVFNAQGQNVLTNAGSTALRYDSTANQFVANWNTKGLPAGSYTVTLALADSMTYTKAVTLSKNGSNANAQAADGGDISLGGTAGQLMGGDLEVYVDNANGDLTADELARIQDAVNAVDAVTEPYGVTVEETTDPTQAEVTLTINSTSPVGGYADGILGCFDPNAGQITLITGWDWYAGSDPTQIGSSQYDFQTTVTHELGHALGLGESVDPTSAMYGTLATGTTVRTLSTADLNLPVDESGADAQRAAPSDDIMPPAPQMIGFTGALPANNAPGGDEPITSLNPQAQPQLADGLSAATDLASVAVVTRVEPSGKTPRPLIVAAFDPIGLPFNGREIPEISGAQGPASSSPLRDRSRPGEHGLRTRGGPPRCRLRSGGSTEPSPSSSGCSRARHL